MSLNTAFTCRRFVRFAPFMAMLLAPGCAHDAPYDIASDDLGAAELDHHAALPLAPETHLIPGDPGPDPDYHQTTTTVGTDWNAVTVSGYALDDDGSFYNEPVYIIKNDSGILASPLPSEIKLDLESNAAPGDAVFSVSSDTVSEIQLSQQLGALTPALQAIAEPVDGPILDPSLQQNLVAGSTVPVKNFFGTCNSHYVAMTKNISVNTPINTSSNLGGGFSGTLSVTGNVQATATMTVTLEQKRFKLFGACIPYAIRFDNVRTSGNAILTQTIGLNGSVSSAHSWEKEIAKIPLGSIDFLIGYVPVHIPLYLPISVGLDLTGNIAASIAYNTSQTATGNFNYTCTLSSCTGTSSYSLSGTQTPTYSGSAQTRVQPSVWAQAAFRAALYDEWVAYAQMGVRPYARGDLWGYYGNNCGDADGNGVNETVNALTFDLDWQVHLTGQARAFGMSPTKWNDLWHTSRKHIGFWNLGGSNGHVPMLGGSSTAVAGMAQTYTAKMRPCWPYTDSVNYKLTWGNGTTMTGSSAPKTAKSFTNTWSTANTYTMGLTAQNDAHGRALNGVTNRSVQVNAPTGTWTAWLDRDNPSGNGDYELLTDFVAAGQVCANPIGIACETTTGIPHTQTGEVYSCSVTNGGTCVNANQPDGACLDYRVRFLCP